MKQILFLLSIYLTFYYFSFAQTAEEYVSRGNAKFEKGDFRGAIEDYTKAIEIKPNYAEAYFNRGKAEADLGGLRSAIEDFNKAIEINPNYAEAYFNRGLAKG
ncbi:MAG: tetratricopeptide repeat protein, partial [Bacteroidota bacterium]